MNTLENLVNTYGFSKAQAQNMLDSYEKNIGGEYGEYTLTDMTYQGNKERKIELTCNTCGEKIYRVYICGRNKLRELPKTCDVCRIRKKEEKEVEEKAARNNVIQNLIGSVHGDYRIKAVENDKYICECTECGTEKTVAVGRVLRGEWKGTRCTKHTVKIKYDESYIGRKNNYLTVLGYTLNNQHRKAFLCKCDCGNTTIVKTTLWENGNVKSCGCYQENRSKDADEIKRIKGIYHGMKRRCLNPNDSDYYNYGGRGIKICDEWLEDVENFIQWSLENGYANTLTIDRIDSNGNYEPDNCRWATYKVQNRNKRPRGKSRKWQDRPMIRKKTPLYCE